MDEKTTCHWQGPNVGSLNNASDALPLSHSGGHPPIHLMGILYVYLNVGGSVSVAHCHYNECGTLFDPCRWQVIFSFTFINIYITVTSDSVPYAFLGVVVC